MVTFELEGRIEATPGQFIMLWLPDRGEKPFSIMSDDPFSVTIARVGPFSECLHGLRPGDTIMWRGPFGHGFRIDQSHSIVLAGGGNGVVPLHFLAQAAKRQKRKVTVLVGARTEDATEEKILFARRFNNLDCDVKVATEDGSNGYRGVITDLVGDLPRDITLYACGPEPMLASLLAWCLKTQTEGQFCLERYMKCGIGICGQCALGDRLVCADGPVFTSSELERIEDFGKYGRDATGGRIPINQRPILCRRS